MSINKPLLKKYLRALRSGKYKQGTGLLRKIDRYCCLGVACEVAGFVGEEKKFKGIYYYGDGPWQTSLLPVDVMEAYGFPRQNPIVNIEGIVELDEEAIEIFNKKAKARHNPGFSYDQPLTMCNDYFCLTFTEISDAVERTFL